MEKTITDKPLLACASSRDDRHHKREEVEDLEGNYPKNESNLETSWHLNAFVSRQIGSHKQMYSQKPTILMTYTSSTKKENKKKVLIAAIWRTPRTNR